MKYDSLALETRQGLVVAMHGMSVCKCDSRLYFMLIVAFESAGVVVDKPLLVTCGGAVVAGMLAFSLYQLGKNVPVYDVRKWG